MAFLVHAGDPPRLEQTWSIYALALHHCSVGVDMRRWA